MEPIFKFPLILFDATFCNSELPMSFVATQGTSPGAEARSPTAELIMMMRPPSFMCFSVWIGTSTYGKSVTFGVTRGCIAVACPVSSITWLISP